MEYIIYLFMLFLSPDGNFDETKDYNSEKDKYETTYDAQGRITFKAKEGATLA
jgi:hypothetical protein